MRNLLLLLLVLSASAAADWRLAVGGSYRPAELEGVGVIQSSWPLAFANQRFAVLAQLDQSVVYTQWQDQSMQWTSQSYAGLGLEVSSRLGFYSGATLGSNLAVLTVIQSSHETFADLATIPTLKFHAGYRKEVNNWFGQLSAHGQTSFKTAQLDVAPYLSRQTTGTVQWYEKSLPAKAEMLQFVAFSIGYKF